VENRAVLITGTSTGIGRTTALHLERLGFTVFAGVRREKDADALRQNSGGRLEPVIIDMTDAGSIKKACEIVSASFGHTGLFGLVNNAGAPLGGPLEFLVLDSVENVFQVNLFGHIRVIQSFLPLLRKQKGRIVNIGSIGGIFPAPLSAPYGASKGAMHTLTHALRRELAPQGVKVSLVIPGNVRTEIWAKTAEMTGTVTSDIEHCYGELMRGMNETAKRMASRGTAPESVARVVADALTRKEPKAQYIVGLDARLQVIASVLLPHRLLDRMMMKAVQRKS
jgi:NAD(P)-dependent dehydrogenase (short-subunit alcohol dehydrogenase family)